MKIRRSAVVLLLALALTGRCLGADWEDFEYEAYSGNWAELDLPLYYQYPALATGCEVTSLAMALGGLGYEIDPEELAEEYLIYSDDMFEGFLGDPFSESGSGIFPSGLETVANDYLYDQESEYGAYDVTGADFYDLLDYVAQGFPVLIWVTIGYEDPIWAYDDEEYWYDDEYWYDEEESEYWYDEEESEYWGDEEDYAYGGYGYWYVNEHCVAIDGFDLDEGTVTLADPLDGWVTLDLDELMDLYEEIGSYALVLM